MHMYSCKRTAVSTVEACRLAGYRGGQPATARSQFTVVGAGGSQILIC